MRPERVPDPVVGIAPASRRHLVHLPVPADAASALGDVDHALEAPVERRVEDGLLVVAAALDPDEREFRVPRRTRRRREAVDVEVAELGLQVGRGLHVRNVRDGIAHLHLARRLREIEREPTVGRLRLERRRVELSVQVDGQAPVTVGHRKRPVRIGGGSLLGERTHDERMRLGLLEAKRHQRRLLAGYEVDARAERVEPDVIAVRPRMRLVPRRAPAVVQGVRCARPRLQTEQAGVAVPRDEQPKAVDPVGNRIIAAD